MLFLTSKSTNLKGKDSKISKEFILTGIHQDQLMSQIAIFEKYLQISNVYNILTEEQMIVNTLRQDDFPTCSFKLFNNGGQIKLWFRDWGEPKGMDCFDLVQRLASCGFSEALELIAFHFGLLSAEKLVQFKYVMTPTQILDLVKKQSRPTELRIKSTDWTKEHIDFWKQYGLEREDVVYDTIPIKLYWYNKSRFTVNKIGFAYRFSDNYDYKIYLPYADKTKGELKFIHSRADIVQGENQLKYNKRVLIITSSNKDVKVLRKQARIYDFDFEVVAPMSETIPISKEKIDFFNSKYDYILLYYNNDKQGLESAEVHSKLYGCLYIVNPVDWPKDPSDVCKHLGEDSLTKFLEEALDFIPPF